MIRINQVKIKTEGTNTEETEDVLLRKKAADILRISRQDIRGLTVVRRSLDARRKPELFYIYTVDVDVKEEEKTLRRAKGNQQITRTAPVKYRFPKPGGKSLKHAPVIVGMGPAGLFCGYYLALHGYKPILLERGKAVEARQKDVEDFWKTGRLDPSSNVQFGEGGAGAFSDGKLNTLVKDRDGRNGEVLRTFVRFGAKNSICYDAKPHIGTDVLCHIVREMRRELIALGGEVRFESQLTDLHIEEGRIRGVVINGGEELACESLVLAIGHSARDTFSMLDKRQVPMEAKSFAVGLRVEHPQAMINESQYGCVEPGELGAAPYKVTAKASNGRGVYSFCMCPGGYVVNASSERGYTAVNGMSYSGRDGKNANSAIIVSVTPEDFGSDHPLAGVEFQRLLEKRAYELGKGKIPVQRYGAFQEMTAHDGAAFQKIMSHNGTAFQETMSHDGAVPQDMGDTAPGSGLQPQCRGEFVWADVSRILPRECNEAFVEGMEAFGRQIRGFNRPDAILSGVESRTSSPVRISRDETMQSSVRGLYPCGEGAGYAGGILSAAMDGLRAAEAIAGEYAPFQRD